MRAWGKSELDSIARLSESFILNYLNLIRLDASQISEEDRGIFSAYWFFPYQIAIYKNTVDDIAIVLKRKVAGKKDKISIRNCNSRIEEAVLPNLDYTQIPMFRFADDSCEIAWCGGTYILGNHPLLTLGLGSEARLMNQRIEASVQGYPMEFELVWFLAFPNRKYLTQEKALANAGQDFWSGLQSVLTRKMETVFAKNLGKETIRLFVNSLEKVRVQMLQLITRQDLAEQQLQEFLEKHYFLLYQDKPIVKESREIGNYKTDFTLYLSDGSKMLIELQLNNDPILVDGKPSRGLSEAIKQVTDWFNWIRTNDLPNLDTYSGLIIIGRKADYVKDKSLIDGFLTETTYPIKLKTYDDLGEAIDKIEYLLHKKK